MRLTAVLLVSLTAFLNIGTTAQENDGDQVLLTYRTATITHCVTANGQDPFSGVDQPTAVIQAPAVTGDPITVIVPAPRCDSCGCNTCVQTVVYTTACDVFCDTGLCNQVYVVTEEYSGVSAKPTISATGLPLGFTSEVQTCTTCGPEPVTATITYPVSGRPYMNSPPSMRPYNGNGVNTAQPGSQATGSSGQNDDGSESQPDYGYGSDDGSSGSDAGSGDAVPKSGVEYQPDAAPTSYSAKPTSPVVVISSGSGVSVFHALLAVVLGSIVYFIVII